MVKIIDDSFNTCSKCGVFKHYISLVHYGETDLCYPCYFFKKYAREAMDEVLKEMAEKHATDLVYWQGKYDELQEKLSKAFKNSEDTYHE
jgi:late competence protein required for DNA uptake (superfamily II DNA/RNA helicase)